MSGVAIKAWRQLKRGEGWQAAFSAQVGRFVGKEVSVSNPRRDLIPSQQRNSALVSQVVCKSKAP